MLDTNDIMLENLGILQDTDTLSDRYDNSCPCSGSALAVYMVTVSRVSDSAHSQLHYYQVLAHSATIHE